MYKNLLLNILVYQTYKEVKAGHYGKNSVRSATGIPTSDASDMALPVTLSVGRSKL